MKYLLNPENGGVFEATDALMKKPGMIPCDKNGKPISATDEKIKEGNKTEYLLNPVTGAIMEWSESLAKKGGLVPVMSVEEGMERYESMKEKNIEKVAEKSEPDEVKVETTDEKPTGVTDEDVDIVIPDEVKSMSKGEIVQYALREFGETLNPRANLRVLQESLTVLLAGKINKDEAALN